MLCRARKKGGGWCASTWRPAFGAARRTPGTPALSGAGPGKGLRASDPLRRSRPVVDRVRQWTPVSSVNLSNLALPKKHCGRMLRPHSPRTRLMTRVRFLPPPSSVFRQWTQPSRAISADGAVRRGIPIIAPRATQCSRWTFVPDRCPSRPRGHPKQTTDVHSNTDENRQIVALCSVAPTGVREMWEGRSASFPGTGTGEPIAETRDRECKMCAMRPAGIFQGENRGRDTSLMVFCAPGAWSHRSRPGGSPDAARP